MAVKHYQKLGTRKKPNTFPLIYLGVFLLLIYFTVLVVQSVWSGIQQDKVITQKKADLEDAKLQEAIAERFLAYQKTPSYIEKQARQHFSYALPGETVVVVPQNANTTETELKNEQNAKIAQNKEKVVSPHLEQWWQYFFGK